MSTPETGSDGLDQQQQHQQPVVQSNNAAAAAATAENNVTPERNASSSFAAIRFSWRENLSSNISNMLQEFRPVFEPSSRNFRANPSDSFVINLDNSQASVVGGSGGDDSPSHNMPNEQIAQPNSMMDSQNEQNDSTNDNNLSDALASIPDTATRYLPYICILIAKSCYDHIDGILDFFALFVTFFHSNKVVRQEITKQGQRSALPLLRELFFIIIVVTVIGFMLDKKNIPLSLLVALPSDEEFTLKRLLFSVGINDLMLKLVTVALKILITLIPLSLLEYKGRGHIYLVVEAFSQMYRALNPIQGWLLFLLNSYVGTEKIVGVILSGAYIVAKGSDLLKRASFCKSAVTKFLEKTSLGSRPTKEQISQVSLCTICHDPLTEPVLLPCNHMFCELCIVTWLSRSSICPLCRATVSDDPNYKDGSTTFFLQLY